MPVRAAARRSIPDRDESTSTSPRRWSSGRPARGRNGASPDSIGVTVRYTYDFVTPLPVVLDALSGGALSLTLSETTVMALNPTY